MTRGPTIRNWLRQNGYEDIADLIDEVMAKWKSQGNKTRRNWWDILSGDRNGKPRRIGDVEFPVLRVAQERQNKKVTSNAISRKKKEKSPPPGVWSSSRWEKD
jgi:hypothetical protein